MFYLPHTHQIQKKLGMGTHCFFLPLQITHSTMRELNLLPLTLLLRWSDNSVILAHGQGGRPSNLARVDLTLGLSQPRHVRTSGAAS